MSIHLHAMAIYFAYMPTPLLTHTHTTHRNAGNSHTNMQFNNWLTDHCWSGSYLSSFVQKSILAQWHAESNAPQIAIGINYFKLHSKVCDWSQEFGVHECWLRVYTIYIPSALRPYFVRIEGTNKMPQNERTNSTNNNNKIYNWCL